MSKKEKIYLRLKLKPKDFTFQEIRTLLHAYEEFSKGKNLAQGWPLFIMI